jgi:hypothetical protein
LAVMPAASPRQANRPWPEILLWVVSKGGIAQSGTPPPKRRFPSSCWALQTGGWNWRGLRLMCNPAAPNMGNRITSHERHQ